MLMTCVRIDVNLMEAFLFSGLSVAQNEKVCKPGAFQHEHMTDRMH